MDALDDPLQILIAVAPCWACALAASIQGRAHTLRHKLLYCFTLASCAALPKCAGCEGQHPLRHACKETHQAVELSVVTSTITLYIPNAVLKVRTPSRMISLGINKNSVVMARGCHGQGWLKLFGIRNAPYAGMGSSMTVE